jgi:hypothetical protein
MTWLNVIYVVKPRVLSVLQTMCMNVCLRRCVNRRDEGVELTARSQHFLRLAPYDRLDFVNAYKDIPLKNQVSV